ncbi:MmgE/PrpD family protein [Hyphomonas sp.]|uniref:MmgE/PrpD family protein n=1 Tax=Hyphomonas sp. TaxID=87 RepID=UPI003919D03D
MSGQTSALPETPAPLTRQLAAHLAAPVSEGDRARAGLHLLDWAGCAAAGRAEPAGRILLSGMDATASARAFAWGGLGNILEMDDVDKRARLHPGPAIIPAALALAIETGAGGEALLSAIVRGYEATIRLGRATGNAHYALWHTTGTCGAIGAAAACASLLGLSEEETAHALALALSQSAGLWQTRHEPASMGKQLHTAAAARAGLEAARLAAAGFLGPLTILEGPQGFFAAMCPGAEPGGVAAPMPGWRIHEVSFKPWPACRHAHAAIDAALALRAEAGAPGPEETIRIETYQDALVFCDKPAPRTVIEAKFSLQHSVAVTLLRGAPQLSDFATEALGNPEIAGLRARISVAATPEFNDAYPARFGTAVTCGARRIAVPDALGDPENPVTEEQVRAKAASLFQAGGISADVAAALITEAPAASPRFLALIQQVLA